MKIRNWIKSVPAALLAAGIWVSPAYAVDIPLGDASFDQTDVNASTYTDYAYIATGHVTAWEDIDSITAGSFGPWWYNSDYDSTRRPTPRTGTQALHGSGDYAWQTVPGGATFETGKSYTLSAYLGGDTDAGTNAWDAADRSWLYIYHADTTPDLSTVFFDDDSLAGFGFNRDRTFFNAAGTGTATNNGWTIGGGSEWGAVSVTYVATAADDGRPIGVGLYGRGDAALEDVALCEGVGCYVPPPQPVLDLSVDRDDGSMTLTNRTGGPVNISGYQLTSAFEALDPANWVSIAGNYDSDSGNVKIDGDPWIELTQVGAHGDLSEGDLASGSGGSLADSQSINLGNAGTWIGNPTGDVSFEYISNGTIVSAIVSYTGAALEPGDFDLDGDIDTNDWAIMRSNQHTDLSGKSLAEAYQLGDMTADLENNHPDFIAFKALFDGANGLGAFQAMIGAVPEPSTVLLLMTGGLFVLTARRRGAACE